MDLANLIKPVLAGGRVRLIGSTTFDEFKQLEKDRALHRRLQKIIVDEPSIEETVKILLDIDRVLVGTDYESLSDTVEP